MSYHDTTPQFRTRRLPSRIAVVYPGEHFLPLVCTDAEDLEEKRTVYGREHPWVEYVRADLAIPNETLAAADNRNWLFGPVAFVGCTLIALAAWAIMAAI